MEQARLRSDQQRFKTEELLKISQQEAEYQKERNQTLDKQLHQYMEDTQVETQRLSLFIENLQEEIENLRKQLQGTPTQKKRGTESLFF